MIKKLDKFILSRFLGPFILAYAVVTFIFLIQHLIRYFRHFVGKDLGWLVFAELFSNFALMLTPVTLPLAVLLSSLMSFGSLGEHSELTAIKGSGISLLRIFRPIAVFVAFLTMGAVYFNDVISPEANLAAFSLLYDIKQKKPTLEFKEGAFYDGLPGYSIRVEKKSGQDGRELEGLMIYNHTAKQGNTDLIIAEKGRMYSTHNGDYLVLEMLKGKRYTDLSVERGAPDEREFLQNDFDSSKIVFSMESFGLKETRKELFKGHNMMKTAVQLSEEKDSVTLLIKKAQEAIPAKAKGYYYYQFADEESKKESDAAKKPKKAAAKKEKAKVDKTTEEYAKKEQGTSKPPPMLGRRQASSDSAKKAKLAETPFANTRKEIWDRIELSALDGSDKNLLDSLMQRKGLPPKEGLKTANTPVTQQTASTTQRQKNRQGASPAKALEERIKQKNRENKLQAKDLKVAKAFKNGIKSDTENATPEDVKKEEESTAMDRGEKRLVSPTTKELAAPWYEETNYRLLNMAWSKANGVKISVQDMERRIKRQYTNQVGIEVELNNKYARAMAVFIMFLIGAPLGAIIKKGGLGVPILISVLFFIIYYITTITGTKLAKSQVVPVIIGSWGGDILLLACGLFFLRQAYKDSRLLDVDYYSVLIENIQRWIKKDKAADKTA